MSTRTVEETQKWLIEYVAKTLKITPSEISTNEILVNLGLSSRQAIVLTSDLEIFLNIQTDPGIVWEYPSIHELANYLGSKT